MNWIMLDRVEQIEELRKESETQLVLIFKHSTRCSVSSTVLNRLERNWKPEGMPMIKTYFLDLISHRSLSNDVADLFRIEHQSPQLMVLRNGSAVYVRSHFDISFDSLKQSVFSKS